MMKYRLGTVVLAVCASAAIALAAAKSPQQIVDERIAGMKTMGGNLKAALGAATPEEAQAKLGAAIAFAETIPSHFPKGTGIGDPGVTKTRALQDIWKKPAEFKAAADALVTALNAASAVAGDKVKLDAAFADVRKSCGGCHTPFRGPETE